MSAPLILGISASLRNARSKTGGEHLVGEILSLDTREELDDYLSNQAKMHLDQFIAAGRAEGKPFDEVYRELRKSGGTRGLSNSEVSLVAALWGAKSKGCRISFASLVDHFPADGSVRGMDHLKAMLRQADGVILATPVYFGDRSSLAQRFLDVIRNDPLLIRDLEGKIYAGVVAAAKRNGGQETTLIYQMLDYLNLGMLAVGNDSMTTSQYGGTTHAGDVGTAPKDSYGIETCVGTGRRVARVAHQLEVSDSYHIKHDDNPRIGFWKLQDRNNELVKYIQPLLEKASSIAKLDVIDIANTEVRPCIACDLCPTHMGPDREYRCIVKRQGDGVLDYHTHLIEADMLMPAVYTALNREGIHTAYQQFMERTRYLRRGDYVFSDRMVAPIIVNEIGANDHMDVRMVTSFIRHHTVMHKPILAWVHKGEVLNLEELRRDIISAVAQGERMLKGRLAMIAEKSAEVVAYNPIGYHISGAREGEDETQISRRYSERERQYRTLNESRSRLEDPRNVA